MPLTDLRNSSSEQLAALLALDADAPPSWRPEELRTMLAQQLAAQVPESAEDPGPGSGAPREERAPASFAEALFHPAPPLPWLERVKRYARSDRDDQNDAPPEEIAVLLYYAAIVAAKLRHGQSISRLSDAVIRDGIRWAVEQPWVDERSRALFAEGMCAFGGDAPETTA